MSNPYAPPEDRPRAPGEPAPPQPEPVPVTPAERQLDRPTWAGPRRERPPADPAAVAKVVRLAGTFGVLVVASVLVATLPLPWRVASLAFAALAVGWGTRAFLVAVRAKLRGGLPVMLALGVVVAVGWVAVSVAWLSFWHAERANQECLDRALTVSARQECAQQLDRDLERRMQDLRDRLGTTS